MSRDANHGGEGWAYTECLWSPTLNRAGSRQGWWELHRNVREDDQILHLRGKGRHAVFSALSRCLSKVQIRKDKPPRPGEWAYANEYFRVDLVDTVLLEEPIGLNELFRTKRDQFIEYFETNSKRSPGRRLSLFYVYQGGRLQCQNGAYLSQIDRELCALILGEKAAIASHPALPKVSRVEVGIRIADSIQRVGQQQFSKQVKKNFKGRCCFPECEVQEDLFLVGSHIARWADVSDLRGQVTNGLSLCLMHDRAFENGMFTLDEHLRIAFLPAGQLSEWSLQHIKPFAGHKIRASRLSPSKEALLHHWYRVGY